MSIPPLARTCGSGTLETIDVELSLEGLVLSLTEVDLHDGSRKPNLVMNFEPFPIL